MKSEITTIEHNEVAFPHALEVEFALLLSKMINSVTQDPEQLRLTIYDFARTKLKNDLSWADESERQRLLGSLEIAILGVEQFSIRSDRLQWQSPPDHTTNLALSKLDAEGKANVPELIDITAKSPARTTASPQRRALASILLMVAFGGLVAVSVAAGSLYWLHGNLAQAVAPATPQSASLRAAPQSQPSAKGSSPGFPTPSDYGVYALDDGKLKELEILPEQVPDKRVAISTPITNPSRTTLSDGRIKFVVYRRDLANNAPERVDVRVVAQVKRELTFDSKGKATIAPVSDAWNIRNIAHVFRVRPVEGNAEMLLMQSENADFVLPAGRYVLVLRNQAYDFTVNGQVTDPAQCLERTAAANGTFYSDCPKL